VKKNYTNPKTGKFIEDNPGRPLGAKNKLTLVKQMDALLDNFIAGKNYTFREALNKKILKKMIVDGDSIMIKEYWQQRDGKPTQRVENEIDANLTINLLNYARDNNPPPIPAEGLPTPDTTGD